MEKLILQQIFVDYLLILSHYQYKNTEELKHNKYIYDEIKNIISL